MEHKVTDSGGFTAVTLPNLLNGTVPITDQNINAAALPGEFTAQQITNILIAAGLISAPSIDTINSGKTFTSFDQAADIVENQMEKVTAGVFTGNAGTLNTFYTSSAQTAEQKRYYYEIFNSGSEGATAEPQFSVVWGHQRGSGSKGENEDSPTKAIYSQYRLLLLEANKQQFTFANSVTSDNIYVINFNRARIKEKLDPGNWQLDLVELSGSFFANNVHTGSNVQVSLPSPSVVKLIDDSGDATQDVLGISGRIYNVVSGTIASGIHKENNTAVTYGLVYPDMGTIVLNGDMLNASASFNSVTGSDIAGDNAYKLFTSISGSAAFDSTLKFTARNEEKIISTHFFVRVRNAEYNFSNNPTYTTGSDGQLAQPTFVGDPKTYITTIGLYNDKQELLAVAKLSKPILKSFQNEVLLKAKFSF